MKTTPIKTKKEILNDMPYQRDNDSEKWYSDTDVLRAMEEYRSQSRPALTEDQIREWFKDKFFDYPFDQILIYIKAFQSHLLSQEGKEEPKGLLTDDCDLNKNKFEMFVGGNGDYYISIISDMGIAHTVRISTSGGIAPTEVKLAIANLYRKMKEAGLLTIKEEPKPKEVTDGCHEYGSNSRNGYKCPKCNKSTVNQPNNQQKPKMIENNLGNADKFWKDNTPHGILKPVNQMMVAYASAVKPDRDQLIKFCNSIRDYEKESHNMIGFDERETFEFVDIYLQSSQEEPKEK